MLYNVTFCTKDDKGMEWMPRTNEPFEVWSDVEDFINLRIELYAGERMLFFASKRGENTTQVYEVFLDSSVKHTVTLT